MGHWWGKLGLGVIPLLLCMLVGAVTGLGGYTFYYAKGGSYFSTDPRACMNCHIMREHYDSWQHASHHNVATCVDCHLPHEFVPKYLAKAENGFWHSKGFTFQDFHEPIRIHAKNARLSQQNCINCHEGLVGHLLDHGSLGDATNSCVRCHPAVGHGPPR